MAQEKGVLWVLKGVNPIQGDRGEVGGDEAMLWVYLQEGASHQSLCTVRQAESLFCRQDGETRGDPPPQLMGSHVNCFVNL